MAATSDLTDVAAGYSKPLYMCSYVQSPARTAQLLYALFPVSEAIWSRKRTTHGVLAFESMHTLPS